MPFPILKIRVLLSVRPAFDAKVLLFAGCKAEPFPAKIKDAAVELDMFAVGLLEQKAQVWDTVKRFFLWILALELSHSLLRERLWN